MKPTLTNILTAHNLSEETPAFTATLNFNGKTYEVRNEGRGGSNRYAPDLSEAEETALNDWAATTQPSIPRGWGINPLACDFETWTFQMAFAAP